MVVNLRWLAACIAWLKDVDPANALWIPGQVELKESQLVGGSIPKQERVSHREYDRKNDDYSEAQEYVEDSTIEVQGVIHPNTQFMVLDELTRMNPHIVNALNPAMENRRIETTTGGVVELPDLIGVVATVNPTEPMEMTFPLSNATKSRFTLGAIMGEYEPAPSKAKNMDDMKKRQYRKGLNEEVRSFKGKPENVTPVVDKATLEIVRDYAAKVKVKDSMPSLIGDLAIDTAEAIKSHGVVETDRRIVGQIEAVAKTLAALRNKEGKLTEVDVTDATEMVVAARLGSHRTRGGVSPTAIADQITAKYA